MKITSLTLTTFRNYRRQTVRFCDGLNVIEGLNTAGKTNLVEAVYLCSVGKSPRGAKDKDLIQIGQDSAHVTLEVAKKHRTHRIDLHLTKDGEKRILLDGVRLSRTGDLMGVLNVVFFSPDELRIVKQDPSERRRFINITLCQQNKPYYEALSRYNHIIDQRNRLLKEARDVASLDAQLAVWDEQLATWGSKIIRWRQDFIAHLGALADSIHRAIAGERCDLTLRYESCTEATDDEAIRQDILGALADSREKEMRLRYTTVGPHRDDFSIVSEEKELRTLGSQGQQRTAALSLKLACIAYFERNTGERPVLLLDDVLSELDGGRRQALLAATDGVQTLLTCTEFTEDEIYVGQRLHVKSGTVEQ